jgi:hypothetical protein
VGIDGVSLPGRPLFEREKEGKRVGWLAGWLPASSISEATFFETASVTEQLRGNRQRRVGPHLQKCLAISAATSRE